MTTALDRTRRLLDQPSAAVIPGQLDLARSNPMTERISLDDLTSDQLDALYDRAEGAEAARNRLLRSRDRQAARAKQAEAEVARVRTAWKSAQARAKRAKRNRDSEVRWAEDMWSDALHDLDRYRKAWTSARHRAAMYLKSNQNFAASLDNSHAAYLQLSARLATAAEAGELAP